MSITRTMRDGRCTRSRCRRDKKRRQGINHVLRGFFSRVSRSRDVRKRMSGRRVTHNRIRRRSAKVKRDVKCKVGYCERARFYRARRAYFLVLLCQTLLFESRTTLGEGRRGTARREVRLGRRFPTRYPDATRIKNYNSRGAASLTRKFSAIAI